MLKIMKNLGSKINNKSVHKSTNAFYTMHTSNCISKIMGLHIVSVSDGA